MGCTYQAARTGEVASAVQNTDLLETIAEILQVDAGDLARCLTYRSIRTGNNARGSAYTIPLSVDGI